jgi:hypothetical protein
MGDADAFAETIGSDYYRETSVGEFLLGTEESKVGRSKVESRTPDR